MSERAIRPFTIGRKNFVLIESDHGTKASAIIYSLVETAKANNQNTYKYLEMLLTVIPNHMDDKNLDFIEALLPWSSVVQQECQSKNIKA
ncbi:MAG: transposase domain-containing protein [Lachnospiraceae bacterium]|nr:transposase domain-containing protein [Lachnospiraceae bacterium]